MLLPSSPRVSASQLAWVIVPKLLHPLLAVVCHGQAPGAARYQPWEVCQVRPAHRPQVLLLKGRGGRRGGGGRRVGATPWGRSAQSPDTRCPLVGLGCCAAASSPQLSAESRCALGCGCTIEAWRARVRAHFRADQPWTIVQANGLLAGGLMVFG